MYKGEWFNSISHLVGAVAGACGLVALVWVALGTDDNWRLFSFSVYGATLLFLFSVSTLYHSARGRAKQILRLLDYHAIYLLIAGTYTPFALVTLRGPWGWGLFATVWALAAVGIALDSPPKDERRRMQLGIYLGMGWLILVALMPLLEALTLAGVLWLLAGGLLYSFGVIFFVLDEKFTHFHGIWHLFVLGGSALHFFTVIQFVE